MSTIASHHEAPGADEPREEPRHAAPASLVGFLRGAADLLLNEIERTREHPNAPPSVLLEAVERSPICLFCCDRDGRLSYLSTHSSRRLSGGPGTSLRDALPGEVFACFEAPLLRALGGEPVAFEVPPVGRLGWDTATTVQLEPQRFADGRAACLAFLVEGGARSERAALAQSGRSAGDLEVELEAQASDVQLVLEAVADAIVTVDEQGSIRGMNAAAERLFKRRAAQARGRHFSALLPDLEDSTATDLLERSRAAGGVDAEARDADGRSIPIHMTISVATDPAVRQLIFAIRDFRAIRAAQQRVLVSQRLAAIGETMTALAHESRNALQRIQSCLTLLQLKADSEETEALVADMQDAQDQLQRLYEEVNNFAAPIELRLRRVDLSQLVDRTWRQLHVKWKAKRLELVNESAVADARVRVDSARIMQVLRNLLENAIDASGEGGRVRVLLAEERNEQGEGIQLSIRDEGEGMPIDVQERAFDLLFTTKEAGTGMGLALARRIVQEHDGTLTIPHSGTGGTTIALRLPRDGGG